MKRNTNVKTLTQLSVLVAIELVLAYTPLGYLRVNPALTISFLMIPVTVGAMLLGPAAGAVLGGVFGLTSFGTCFGADPFGAALLSISPFFTFLTCVPTRILAGWLVGVIFKALNKPQAAAKAPANLALGVSALTGPVLNTLLFTGCLVLCFYRTDFIQGFVATLGAANPLSFMVLFVGLNGLVEAAAGFVVNSLLGRALWPFAKRS